MEKKDICKGEGYELAELKSSLLVQTLILEDNPHNILLEFIQTLAKDICEYMEVDLRDIIVKYTSKLGKGDGQAEYEIVAQSHVWANYKWLGPENMDTQDTQLLPTIPRGVYTNVFAMINFIKWLWYDINDIDNNNTSPVIFLGVLVHSFQQNIIHLHNRLRGERKDDLSSNTPTSTDVGISNIRDVEHLKRRVRDVPNAQIKPWVPFGREVCNMGINIYMERLNQYRSHTDYINNFYSSVMCGISGSSQFTLFMFLCSIAGKGTDPCYNKVLVGQVLQIACVTLVGAGGHNIREVLSGLVISVVFLYHIIIDVLDEISSFSKISTVFKDIYCYISSTKGEDYPMTRRICHLVDNHNPGGHSDGRIPDHICFLNIVKTLENWRGFITTFYEETKDYNMLGLFVNDIDDLKDVSFETCKDRVYNHIIGGRRIDTDLSDITKHIELFYSLENNRLHLDPNTSFRDFPSNFMDTINIRLHLNSNLGVRITHIVSELRKRCALSDLPDGLIRAITLNVKPLTQDRISNFIHSNYNNIYIPFA